MRWLKLFYPHNIILTLFVFSEADVYNYRDDDFIFEDFARLRLKGHDGDDTEA